MFFYLLVRMIIPKEEKHCSFKQWIHYLIRHPRTHFCRKFMRISCSSVNVSQWLVGGGVLNQHTTLHVIAVIILCSDCMHFGTYSKRACKNKWTLSWIEYSRVIKSEMLSRGGGKAITMQHLRNRVTFSDDADETPERISPIVLLL